MKSDSEQRFYNVGTGTRTLLRELAELLLNITGSSQKIRYKPSSQITLVRNRIGCTKRAKEEVGFEASVPLDNCLEALIEWRSAHKAEVDARRRKVHQPTPKGIEDTATSRTIVGT